MKRTLVGLALFVAACKADKPVEPASKEDVALCGTYAELMTHVLSARGECAFSGELGEEEHEDFDEPVPGPENRSRISGACEKAFAAKACAERDRTALSQLVQCAAPLGRCDLSTPNDAAKKWSAAMAACFQKAAHPSDACADAMLAAAAK